MRYSEETLFEGVTVRRPLDYPMFLVSADGRIIGPRGQWLKPRKTAGKDNVRLTVMAHTEVGRKNVLVHRLVALAFITQPEGRDFVDHIDGDYYNNTKDNLRWTTTRGNGQNMRCHRDKTTASKYVGVTWFKLRGYWRSSFRKAGQKTQANYFKDEEAAARDYDRQCIEIGEEPVNFK